MRFDRSVVGFVVVAAIAAGLSGTHAGAQESGPVADGEFSGAISLDGGFSMTVPQGTLVWTGNGSGPAQITLTGGVMTGSWSMSGTSAINGQFVQSGAELLIDGTGTNTGSGTFSGPPGAYRLSGTASGTSTATVRIPAVGLSQSATDSYSDSLDEALTDVIVLCDMIVGRWDLRIRQQLQDIGFDEFIRGYFSVSTGVDAAEQAEQVTALLEGIASWAGQASAVEMPSRALYLGTALSLLDQAQRLQAQLAAPTPCPPDGRFTTQLALAVQDVIARLVDRLPGITTSSLVSLAIGSGAIGSGSALPAQAQQTADLLVADIQAKWNVLVADPGVSEADLVDTARAAQMLGIQELGGPDGVGLSPSDVLIVFGAGS